MQSLNGFNAASMRCVYARLGYQGHDRNALGTAPKGGASFTTRRVERGCKNGSSFRPKRCTDTSSACNQRWAARVLRVVRVKPFQSLKRWTKWKIVMLFWLGFCIINEPLRIMMQHPGFQPGPGVENKTYPGPFWPLSMGMIQAKPLPFKQSM